MNVAHEGTDVQPTRRDFLYVATGAAGVVATGAAVWPLVDQMNPSADVLALSSIEVDVGEMEEGTQLTAKWRGKPCGGAAFAMFCQLVCTLSGIKGCCPLFGS